MKKRFFLWSFLAVLVAASGLTGYLALAGPADVVLVGAGDIASCDSPGDEATAELIDNIPGTVFVAGDAVYQAGTPKQFTDCYNPSWGRFKARTLPAVGNHEYGTHDAAGYFGYFGAAAGDPKQGYYSYDLGAWHIIVINSNCGKIGSCNVGSPQEQWLRDDLRAHPAACTLAYWHHARFGSGQQGSYAELQPIWQALYDAGADVAISGHDHDYERFAPQDPTGASDPARGMREFVVGTGGKDHQPFRTPIANSELRNPDTFGVLKLTLHATSYDWQFVPEAGKTFTDSGHGECHNGGLLTLRMLIASFRSHVPDSGPVISVPTPALVLTPAASLPFSDGFESSDLSRWTAVDGLIVQRQEVASGTYAARSTSRGAAAYAIKQLIDSQSELYYRIRFKILSQNTAVNVLKLRTDDNRAILGIYISNVGKLGYRNEVTGMSTASSADVSRAAWHELQIHVRIAEAAGQIEVWLDNARIDVLSKTEAFGDDAIGKIQLGENATGRTYDIAFDDIAVAAHFINR